MDFEGSPYIIQENSPYNPSHRQGPRHLGVLKGSLSTFETLSLELLRAYSFDKTVLATPISTSEPLHDTGSSFGVLGSGE